MLLHSFPRQVIFAKVLYSYCDETSALVSCPPPPRIRVLARSVTNLYNQSQPQLFNGAPRHSHLVSRDFETVLCDSRKQRFRYLDGELELYLPADNTSPPRIPHESAQHTGHKGSRPL